MIIYIDKIAQFEKEIKDDQNPGPAVRWGARLILTTEHQPHNLEVINEK